MKDYTSENPVFSENISIVEESDLINADNNNAAAEQLLQNDLVLMNSKVDKEDGKSLVADTEREAWNQTYQQSTGYTDQKIAELINGAPSTLNTLGKIADAMSDNQDVVEALDAAIGTKANQEEMESWLGTKLDKTGDSKDNTVTFGSSDTLTPSAWTDVDVLKSGETHKSFANKVSTMFKNMRYLRKLLGSTDISTIADGTITGALNQLNTGMINRTFDNTISVGFKLYGGGVVTLIPVSSTKQKINITKYEIFTGAWIELNIHSQYKRGTYFYLTSNDTSELTEGNAYLVRYTGEIT